MKVENISSRQFTTLVMFYTIGSAILLLPSPLASISKNDAWVACIFGTIIGVLLIYFYSKIALLYPHLTFVELTEKILGKILGKTVSVLFLSFCFIISSGLLWDMGDFVVTQIMPETPIHVIYIMFILVALYGIRLGIETIARASEIFLPWVSFLLILLFIVLLPTYEYKNMVPVFENGFVPILQGTYLMFGLPFLQLFVFLMVVPAINAKDKLSKAFTSGVLYGSICLTFITLACILVLGTDFTTRNISPVYILGKKVSIANFIERVEVIVAIIWFLTIYFKLTITMYACILGISKVLDLKDYRPLIFPFGMILIVGALVMLPNHLYVVDYLKYTWTPLATVIGVFLPLIMYLVDFIKKRRTKQSKGNTSTKSY